MHASSTLQVARDTSTHARPPASERKFYESYDWCLNPYITVSEAVAHLREEVERLAKVPADWRSQEVSINIFLLACGLLNCIDEYLRGPSLRFPSSIRDNVLCRSTSVLFEALCSPRMTRFSLHAWRNQFFTALHEYLCPLVGSHFGQTPDLLTPARRLAAIVRRDLPHGLLAARLNAPTTFRRLELTHHDIFALGNVFTDRIPDRSQAVLIVGLRTAGSYLAPLLGAYLEFAGYKLVRVLTIEPNKGGGRREKRALRQFAKHGYVAAIVDDPPYTNRSVLAAIDIVSRAGFPNEHIKLLAPTHTAKRTWGSTLPRNSVITLEPEHWYKNKKFEPKAIEVHLREYWPPPVKVRLITDSIQASAFDRLLRASPSDERGVRLKRVFELEVQTPTGAKQTTFVVAKSVGWGWLGYHAFLAGDRLSQHVPPILGQRDGILYMEYIPHRAVQTESERSELVSACASYVAARARHLKLRCGNVGSIGLKRYDNGMRILEKALSRAYGSAFAHILSRARLGQTLRARPCPSPTLIDGNMDPNEWLAGPNGPVKVDFEHHGMGKAALNITDPAYDLADTILRLDLSPDEERALIGRYISDSGDVDVRKRLFLQKVLAGLWTMNEVQEQLFSSPRGSAAQRHYHARFMRSWHFLTVQAARYCGALCRPRHELRWGAPLVVLDIDGVLDRRLFGFPCSTAAGIEAMSLLVAHDFTIALNTARSASEIKEYCKAYSVAGAVAEHGSYLWDAVRQRDKVLISAEADRQLKELRNHLRQVPGVFLDERHQYSIRAFAYRDKPLGLIQTVLGSAKASSIGDGALGPISTQTLHQLLVDLKLDRLTFHHTPLDTAIFAKEVNKGTGLSELCEWALFPGVETIAVGDAEPDLAMFRVASRSYAPANIGCKRQARLLGCQIARSPNQRGLLEIVRTIAACREERVGPRDLEKISVFNDDLFISLLRIADRTPMHNLMKAALDPLAYTFFVRA
jgi:hydroxymethylpyrimidine pyrophosphatase-like HAD family hydrolase